MIIGETMGMKLGDSLIMHSICMVVVSICGHRLTAMYTSLL